MPPKPPAPPRASRAKPASPAPVSAASKPWPPRGASPRKPFLGYSFAFFGEFALWPAYHGASPAEVAALRGADVRAKVDATLDCVVFGDLRGAGRAEAKKRAAKLRAAQGPLRVLDEGAYRELVRVDLTGKQFFFVGSFDCSPGGIDDGLLTRMVQRAGGEVAAEMSSALDYLVVGNRQGPSKVATQNKAQKLNEAGASITKLTETGFLELVRVEEPTGESAASDREMRGTLEMDFTGFLSQLYGRVKRATAWEEFLLMLPKARGAFHDLHDRTRVSLADRVAVKYGLRAEEGDTLAKLETTAGAAARIMALDQRTGEIMRDWELD